MKTMSAIKADHGFTIVEVIVAIVIMSLLGAVILSRFSDANQFNGLVVRDQIISLARTAQQNSLGRPAVVMTITPDGNDVDIVTSSNGTTIESVTTSMSTLSLTGDRNETASCGVTGGGAISTSGGSMTFTFGELGDIASPSGVTGDTGAVVSGLRVCINNDPALSVCVSPSGYAYPGDCDV